ncbi:MAG: hypothetical protein A2836_01480 [Candidatus Taylorbacteria bacterium RIFCSPHIGHO2_01_FULL_45_63]|uniref:Uncharacterized protein n=1 Tax=Candidatus Taylorbacteria bacterium RIFCSPHIGHO2_02_FULL_45_35 TaxID=1802311 RepID=A0A1G2MYI7_9BACT|nr:MAG: hypothetical protein A2836_01480 [Candidatus Taylorbacteria bacterium RIFCSPHIGHO2_01_FULL_45_63]OHA28082.1 MAG: hypothetical protein A3D56_00180 [Candidatus Taylorbacteria bacterium RIFCSPHIGHO2_02_FULL_45_35]OHA34908.1 MAG: hypothetical protein A3A22_02980 [Candidatus Taylorbacteria bacterium RIFCSPLOWO2_01_FULL_45_34b]
MKELFVNLLAIFIAIGGIVFLISGPKGLNRYVRWAGKLARKIIKWTLTVVVIPLVVYLLRESQHLLVLFFRWLRPYATRFGRWFWRQVRIIAPQIYPTLRAFAHWLSARVSGLVAHLRRRSP